MIIKEISTQHKDESGNPLYLLRDSNNYPADEWKKILQYLKRNKEAGLLKYEIVKN